MQREDDNPQVVKKRWAVFIEDVDKILDFYQKKKKLIKVNGRGRIAEVFERVKQELQ